MINLIPKLNRRQTPMERSLDLKKRSLEFIYSSFFIMGSFRVLPLKIPFMFCPLLLYLRPSFYCPLQAAYLYALLEKPIHLLLHLLYLIVVLEFVTY